MKPSDDQVTQYEEDGYFVMEGLMTDEEVEELRVEAERIAAGEVDFPVELVEFEPHAAPRGGETFDPRPRGADRARQGECVISSQLADAPVRVEQYADAAAGVGHALHECKVQVDWRCSSEATISVVGWARVRGVRVILLLW